MHRLIRQMQENPNRVARIAFVPAEAGDLKLSLARAEPQDRIIRYRPQLMEWVEKGDPEASEVFLEEIGHALMHSSSMALDHFVGKDLRALNIESVSRKELEAQKFVWYAAAPVSEVYGQTDPQYLVKSFGLTLASAKEYVNHLRRTKNRIEKSGRQLPEGVIDFLAKAKEKGHLVKTILPASAQIESSSGPLIETTAPTKLSASSQVNASFLPELCKNCQEMTLRMLGGCKQCVNCGDNQGCD